MVCSLLTDPNQARNYSVFLGEERRSTMVENSREIYIKPPFFFVPPSRGTTLLYASMRYVCLSMNYSRKNKQTTHRVRAMLVLPSPSDGIPDDEKN